MDEHEPGSVYRREGDTTLVEIRLREVRQLFNTLDPAAFHEQDLDPAAERYLTDACREAGLRRKLRLVVHLPAAEAASAAARTLPDAVHHYFAYREAQLGTDLRQLLRTGFASLAIGLLFLVTCLTVRRALFGGRLLADPAVVGEGLLILGWVAMWRPTELLLYDWWPLTRHRRLLARLARVPVEIRVRD